MSSFWSPVTAFWSKSWSSSFSSVAAASSLTSRLPSIFPVAYSQHSSQSDPAKMSALSQQSSGQNPPVTSHLLSIQAQILDNSLRALPHSVTDLLSCHQVPPVHFIWSTLTHQTQSHLRAFARAVPLPGGLLSQISKQLAQSLHSGLYADVTLPERSFLTNFSNISTPPPPPPSPRNTHTHSVSLCPFYPALIFILALTPLNTDCNYLCVVHLYIPIPQCQLHEKTGYLQSLDHGRFSINSWW